MSRVMLITGASRGIGAATARLAAHQGYALCLNYHQREDAVKQVLEQVRTAGVSAITVKADVADEGQVLQMFEMIDREFGRLDVLVNNAGMLEQQMRLEQMDAARWMRVLGTNVIGSFLCAREAIKRMSNQHGGQGGSIINLSSIAARLGAPGNTSTMPRPRAPLTA